MQATKLIIAALAALGTAGASAHTTPSLAITDLSVAADTAGVVNLRYTVDPGRFDIATDREVTLTPVIYNGDSTLTATMPPVVVAGRTRYLRYVRDPKSLPPRAVLLRSGHDAPYVYTGAVDYRPWMQQSTVGFDAAETGCCGAPERYTATPVARIDLRPRRYNAPEFIVEAPPVVNGKTVELHGQAYVDFRVNRTEIDPEYRRNPSELAKIIATVNVVRENPDATINAITIKGFASPEGPYRNNIRLARGRTAALRDYVRSQYTFPDSIFTTDFEPEDWDGFRDSMLVSILPNRSAILELIDSDLAPDAKDAAIRSRFPRDYRYILDNIYPALRHSDYTVRYTIREYTDIDEIRRVMRERPGNLSLHEFHLLASSYTPGSPEYDEVFDIAVRMFPEDTVSNLNAAAVAINQSRWENADNYLSKAGNRPEVTYLRGIMAARRGDLVSARNLLGRAKTDGVAAASLALANLDTLESMGDPVTYIDDRSDNTFTKR